MQLKPTELDFTSTERGSRMRRILLVEPHRALRQALVSLLNQESDLTVIAEVGSLDEYRRISLEEIDVTVAEVSLPDGDGTDLIRDIVPYGVPVVVTTLNLRSTTRARALEAGASEVLGKDISFEELVGAIKRVAGNDRARSPFSDDQRSGAPPEP
jgi:two-component system response regulator DesR